MPTTPISQHMTASPHSIGVDQPLATAHHLLREHGIRHLPVLQGGKLVGLLSDRDLQLIEALTKTEVAQHQTITVEEAMSQVPYAVAPSASLKDVVATMGEKRLGSAVVMDGPKVVGIFTTTDACRLLASLLDR